MRKPISRLLFTCLLALDILPIVSIAAEAVAPQVASTVLPASSASPNGARAAPHTSSASPASSVSSFSSGASVAPSVDGAYPASAPLSASGTGAGATGHAPAEGSTSDVKASAAQSAGVITPADARRAVAVLQDSRERAQAVDTLKAIAAVSPASMPVFVSPPAVVSAPTTSAGAASSPSVAAASSAAAASAASSTATAPIRANGLIAQLLRQVAHWADGLADQLQKIGQVIVGLPAFGAWLVHTFGTPYGQQLAIKSLTALAAVFASGLLLEWALRRILRRPRSALIEHADALERRVRDRAVREAKERREKLREAREAAVAQEAVEQAARAADAAAARQAPTSGTSGTSTSKAATRAAGVTQATASTLAANASAANPNPTSSAASPSSTDAAPESDKPALDQAAVDQANAAAAGTADGRGDIALVRTQVDGTERVEAVRVDAGDGASGGAAVEAMAAAAESAAPDDDEEAADEREAGIPVRSAEHWSTLRHLPFALGALVLDLLPLLLFFVTGGLVLRWLAGESGAIQDMTEGFVNAYIVTRVTMAVIRLLVSPVGHGLRVLRVSPDMSRTVEHWVRRIVVLGAFGVALTNGAGAMGASHSGQVAFMKLVSLLVHSFTVVLIFRTRRPVGALIAAKSAADGPIAAIRNWLADVWPFFASFVVMAVWVVWALGVEDGFPKLIHFIGVSVGVIIAARLAAILLLGALGRAFHPDAKDAAQAGATSRLANRYYPIVRAVVTAIIIVCAIVGLFEVWGFNAIGWFTRGPVGRNLTSAALTIAVAVVVAVAVWESANAGVERRLARWAERGDNVRAARLRTLLPMLRTCLFICILLMVGLTALNEIGINTTPLLAGASIIGVALGFGSQKLVQDFITGIFLLMENAMQVGDYVTVAGVSGSVEYLSIRTVRLRASDGSLFIVPFSSVTTVNNTNRGLGNASVKVSVAYDSDVDQVIDELKAIGTSIRQDPNFADLTLGDLELWGVDSVDGSMVTVAGQIRCLDKGRWGVQREFNRRMFERFRELGIEISNPRATWVVSSGNAPGALTVDGHSAAAPPTAN